LTFYWFLEFSHLAYKGAEFSHTKYDFVWRRQDRPLKDQILGKILDHFGGRLPHGAPVPAGYIGRTEYSFANIFDRFTMGDRGEEDDRRPRLVLDQLWDGGLSDLYASTEGKLTATIFTRVCKVTFMTPEQLVVAMRTKAAKLTAKLAEQDLGKELDVSGITAKVEDYMRDVAKLCLGKTGAVIVTDLKEALKRLGLRGLDKRGNKPALLKLLWDNCVSALAKEDTPANVLRAAAAEESAANETQAAEDAEDAAFAEDAEAPQDGPTPTDENAILGRQARIQSETLRASGPSPIEELLSGEHAEAAQASMTYVTPRRSGRNTKRTKLAGE
jgi:hypothetical protein